MILIVIGGKVYIYKYLYDIDPCTKMDEHITQIYLKSVRENQDYYILLQMKMSRKVIN